MALISCPECGKTNVSDTAVSCPECGFAVKEYFDKIRLEEQRIATEKAKAKHRKETESERQKETVQRLENQIEESSQEVIKSVIGLVFSLPLAILCWYGGLGVLLLICITTAFVSVVFLIGGIHEKNTALNDLEKAKRNINEYEAFVEARSKAYIAQSKASAAKHPKCPMCGSSNTERIGTLSRIASISIIGLASSKIGKQYQCKNCKHKW